MTITPAIKGQLTKAAKEAVGPRTLHIRVMNIYLRHMPREQAKHATRKFVAAMPHG